MDIISNRLDTFISSEGFGGLNWHDWGPSVCLYHYTNLNHVESINSNLCCMNIGRYIQDGELDCGITFVKTHKSILPKNIVDKVCERITALRDSLSLPFWTFSLCRNGNSQHMWTNYSLKCKGEPCVIAMDGEEIYRQTQNLMEKSLLGGSQRLYFFLPCFYLPRDEEKVTQLLRFIFSDDYYGSLLMQSHFSNEIQLAVDLCVMFSLMIKDCEVGTCDYNKEEETRLIVYDNKLGGSAESVSFGLNKGCVKCIKHQLLSSFEKYCGE